MERNRMTYIKNILIPCLLFSCITGVLTGGLIFVFKLAVLFAMKLSGDAYGFVRANPVWLPILLLGAGVLGLIAGFLLRRSKNCRGGGIPTSVSVLRGLIEFSWLKNIFLLFSASMMTYLCGVPLDNEGPSVQMGTAVGRGAVRMFAKKHQAWDRYVMTGGACAGFAAATGAPVTGIFFAFEEAHRRFSPMIFMTASMTVVASAATMEFLCGLVGISSAMFGFSVNAVLPLQSIWIAVVIGLVCGGCAILFTKLYSACEHWLEHHLKRMPLTVKFMIIFIAVALIGFVSSQCIGSGHHLIDGLVEGYGVWYLLIVYFCVRAILLVVAINSGVCGGLSVPTLAFGAILGALCGQGLIAIGWLDAEYYAVSVIIGMASFMSASSRTPITAIAFAIEAFCGFGNILPIAIGVTFSYLVIETCGVEAFNEAVVESRIADENRGKTAQIINAYVVVAEDAFVVGKEIRDILWPPTCTVLSVDRSSAYVPGMTGITAGDVLHLHYQTYEPADTMETLESLVGKQSDHIRTNMHPGSDTHQVPEL